MNNRISRRAFFRNIGLGTIGAGLGMSSLDRVALYAEAMTEEEKHEMLTKGTVDFMGFTAKEITPNDEFYLTSYSTEVPEIESSSFSLRVDGLVERPYSIGMKEIMEMTDKREFVTLECIGNSVGGDLVGNALWEGVTLEKIISSASPKKGIVKAVFYGKDGYSDSIPYDLALSGDVFIAYRMNGKTLPRKHGHPIRAIVPGIYGMKNVKWLERIELVDFDYKGYWEKRGWSDSAVMALKSQILMPMNGKRIQSDSYVIGGVAYAGRHGISRVEVSLDGGRSWREAETKPPLSRWAWVLWKYDWRPGRKGSYTITVRAADKSGNLQEEGSFFERSYPDGARGYHSVDVKVS